MRIVFINPVGALGGGERSLIDLLFALRHENPLLAVELLVLGPGPLVDLARELGFEVHLLALPVDLQRLGDSFLSKENPGNLISKIYKWFKILLQAFTFGLTLRKVLKRLDPTIIHSNGIKAHILSALCAPKSARLIWHIRDYIGSRRLAGRLLALLRYRVHTLIAISHSIEEDLRRSLPNTPCRVVYNGIDCQHFVPIKGANPAKKTLTVGLPATYAKWKGHEVFISAAKHLVDMNKHSHLRFVILGGSLYATDHSQYTLRELKDLCHVHQVSNIVELHDFALDPLDALRAMDIIVNASTKPEPFGRTIVEGMALEKVVIGTAHGGATELITNGVNGLLVAPGDPHALAKAISALSNDETLRRDLGLSGRKTVVERFNRLTLGKQMLAIYAATKTAASA